MRVSPAALLNRRRDLSLALAAANRVAEATHNHPEGMKGARAAVHATWLAFQGERPEGIRAAIAREHGYSMDRSVDRIRPAYAFDATCQGSVPEAIICALESASFEGAMRNAVSLGGDADTLAAIAGPVAEALHGIPPAVVAGVGRYFSGSGEAVLSAVREMYGDAGRHGLGRLQ